MKTSNHSRYLVKSLVHASRVLEAFQSAGDVLRLRDVVTRTGYNKGMCFRLLYTLHQCGFLDKVGENHYRLASEVRRRRLYRIGYAAQGQDTSFDREVRTSLTRAAEREHVELITVDNRYQPKIALRSADYLIKEQVDLVIEFQTDEGIAPAIASKYLEANIPFIAIDIPHPGATYFGANNYQAGLMAGHYLGRWAKKQWNGEIDEILLLELHRAGSLPRARMRGILTGIGEVIRVPDRCRTVSIDGDGQFQTALERVRKHLRESKAKRVLVGAANDPSALGSIRAFEEAGRGNDCAVAGQNAEPEARAELRTPGTRLIASVAYFPEKYGDGLLRLALDILSRKAVPPAVFTNHQVITTDNVDHFYPNDSLLAVPG
ncbi:MAG TPA: substrate-binding domain-containing protein [Candidatus Acidoferrales bacterium]|nr:substrate-binding domain-containing protein [Bryobacteraceae bacterium]HTS65299.1 substrate-binding domain-containing protein [Candidatus Acidoferrales bacterium]